MIGVLLIGGCSSYYPSEIRIDNQAGERVLVDISKNNTKVDITIQEKPRELVEYYLKGDQPIQIYCVDEINNQIILNHSILSEYQREKVVRENVVYTYPRFDVNSMQNVLKINNSNYLDCYLKGMLELSRISYVDGIFISNNTEFVRFSDIFKTREFSMDCINYNNKPQNECLVTSTSYELRQFIESPKGAGYYIFEYIIELK